MKSFQRFYVVSIMVMLCIGCNPKLIQPGVRQIVTFQGAYEPPIWSSAGDELLTSWYLFEARISKIYIFNIKTGKHRLILHDSGAMYPLAWSPDGTKIVLSSFSAANYEEGIWIIDLASMAAQYLGLGDEAVWSPNGDKLAIYSCEKSASLTFAASIRLYDMSTGEETMIYRQDQCMRGAFLAWSPNGTSLAFSYPKESYPNNTLERIYLLDLDNGQIDILYDELNWSPSWSPKENILVYLSSEDERINSRLNIIDITTGCKKQVTGLNIEMIGAVSWSPDGTKWAVWDYGDMYIVDVVTFLGEDILENGISCP